MTDDDYRTERDSLGEMQVPADAYWGAQTQRAVENFPISGETFGRRFVRALGVVKKAATQANRDLELVPGEKADPIVEAADEVIAGEHDDQFPVDVFQTGSGTSSNMNANEVIANRATEIYGGDLGSREIHPNDHVNFGQSSNDVIPTAMHVASAEAVETDVRPALERLADALGEKEDEFDDVVKTGRTHLQDATPVTLGQEFGGYRTQIEKDIERVDGRPAQREFAQVRPDGVDPLNALLYLGSVAAELLAERDGRGVLEVGASGLDDVVERRFLRGEFLPERLQGRDHVALDRLEGGDVHRGGDDVVRRLAEVDVVVGVDDPVADRRAQ